MYSLFVGIDVSKDSFAVAGLDDKAKVVFRAVPEMDAQGFMEFMKIISPYSVDSVVIALESTGPYHLNLLSFLTAKGYTTLVLNPLVIANFTKLSLRKTKTDRKDALTIARFLFLHRDKLHQIPTSQTTTDLRDLARERESILKIIASMKNDIKRILQSTFPELEKLVNPLGDTMLHFLKLFPSARHIVTATPQTVAQAFNQGDGRRRISVPYTDIIELARISVGTTSPSKEMILPGKIDTLLHLNQRLDHVTRMLVCLCRALEREELDLLMSIRGVNVKTAAPFLAELGDHRDFASYKKVIAFAGLDPTIHQSGKFEGASMISRRGNRHLRRVIYHMAFCVIRYEGAFRAYFFRRKQEGLPFRKALMATAHKLIRTIFTMLAKRTRYAVEVC